MVRRLPDPALKNPFKHRLNLSTLQILELVIGAVTLLPLRLLVLVIVWPLVWLTVILPTIGCSVGSTMAPWPRMFITTVTRFGVRVILWLFGFLWVRTKGKRASYKDIPVNVVGPHTMPFDGFFTGGVIFGSMLICHEVEESFFLRPILIATDGISVNRSSADTRAKVTEQVNEFLRNPNRRTHLMAFPEGTCGNGKALFCFRRGAFLPGAPVQPITLNSEGAPQLAIWTYDSFGAVVGCLLQLCRLYTPLEIQFLDPYFPSEAEKKDPMLYANNVQAVMARTLGLPHTQHTGDDGVLAYKALSLGLDSGVATIELGLVKPALGLNLDALKEQLVRYAKFNTTKNGSLTLEEMADYLAWPEDSHVEALFREYDTGKHDALTYRDFLFGLVDMARVVPDQDALQSSAFEIMSRDSDTIKVEGVRALFEKGGINISADDARDLIGRWMELTKEETPSGVTRDAFYDVMRNNPEYLVFVQWIQHGMHSFPVPIETAAEDEPDKRKRR